MMEGYLRQKFLTALVATVALGVLLFGFQNFTNVQAEPTNQKVALVNNLDCPFTPPEKSTR